MVSRYPCGRSIGVRSRSNTLTSTPAVRRPWARHSPPVPAPTTSTRKFAMALPRCRVVQTLGESIESTVDRRRKASIRAIISVVVFGSLAVCDVDEDFRYLGTSGRLPRLSARSAAGYRRYAHVRRHGRARVGAEFEAAGREQGERPCDGLGSLPLLSVACFLSFGSA
jgi:hypothetical protein